MRACSRARARTSSCIYVRLRAWVRARGCVCARVGVRVRARLGEAGALELGEGLGVGAEGARRLADLEALRLTLGPRLDALRDVVSSPHYVASHPKYHVMLHRDVVPS